MRAPATVVTQFPSQVGQAFAVACGVQGLAAVAAKSQLWWGCCPRSQMVCVFALAAVALPSTALNLCLQGRHTRRQRDKEAAAVKGFLRGGGMA